MKTDIKSVPPTCPNCHEQVTHEGAHLAPLAPSPEPEPVEMVRLGKDEIYCGTAFGVPMIARGVPEKTPEEIASDRAFASAKEIASWKVQHGLAEGPRSRQCARSECGKTFTPSDDHPHGIYAAICDECAEDLRPPKPDPKPVAAPTPSSSPVAPIPKPVGRPTEAGPDSNPSRGDHLSNLVPGFGRKKP